MIHTAHSDPKPPVLLVGNFLQTQLKAFGVCEELALRLAQSGWPVLTTSNRVNRLSRLVDMVGTAWSKRHRYAVAQVDVYSGAAFFWAEAVCAVLSAAGRPYVLTMRGGNLPVLGRRWPGRVRRLFASAAAVVAPSRYLYEQMQPYRADLVLLPNPLALAHYPFKLRERPRPELVWLRAIHAIYNPSLAPRVLALLADEFPDIHLTMVGPDKADGSLQELRRVAEEKGVAARITIVGGVPKADVPTWMNKGDIFLNTTNIDNTPVSVLEAMACGLCVVSTNVGGIPYMLDDNQDSLLVPPDDAEAMAAAVRRILTEPALAMQLSHNARIKTEQFDWATILPRWEELFKCVIRNEKLEVRSQKSEIRTSPRKTDF